jgi:hypothetical protein
MNTVQLNVEIPRKEAEAAKEDVWELRAKLNAYVEEALRHFRKSLPVAERRRRFEEASKRKLTGRPVKA